MELNAFLKHRLPEASGLPEVSARIVKRRETLGAVEGEGGFARRGKVEVATDKHDVVGGVLAGESQVIRDGGRDAVDLRGSEAEVMYVIKY